MLLFKSIIFKHYFKSFQAILCSWDTHLLRYILIPVISPFFSAGSFYKSSFTENFRVRVRYDGRITWAFGGEMSTICTLDMTFYPLDLQKCELQIENWAYNGLEVSLINKRSSIEMDAYEPNGVWTVVSTHTQHYNHTYVAEGDAHFPEIRFTLYLKRKALFYVLNLVVPCGLIIIVALAVFWLPADSGEKVSLGVTVLLAFSVFQLVIAEHTPVNSDFTPVLGWFRYVMIL